MKTVTIVCLGCRTANDVAARATVSFKGGEIPTFDPPLCTGCHRLLRPSPDEWANLLFGIANDGIDVPPDWWDRYARRNPPLTTT